MSKQLITEQTIRELMSKGTKTLVLPRGAIVTPLAAELAASKGVKFEESKAVVKPVENEPSRAAKPVHGDAKVVAFGSDHGGFQLKETLKKHAESLGYQVVDVGTTSEDPCDYPDFAYAVAAMVSRGEASRGVMIDGAGIGSCVVANKVPGVRAACCHNEFVARNAREHNDTNVLTLGSRVIGSEVSKEIMKVWLETWFAGGRHKQRVDKITDVEKRFSK
ncbi:MAG: ribose 5-phosphate isomerase B [Bacteroidota bacterium]